MYLLWNRAIEYFGRRTTVQTYTWWSYRTASRNYSRTDYARASLWHSPRRRLHILLLLRGSSRSQSRKRYAARHDLPIIKINEWGIRDPKQRTSIGDMNMLSFFSNRMSDWDYLLNPMADIGRVTISAINPCTLLAPLANNRMLRLGFCVLNNFFSSGELTSKWPISLVVIL